LRNYPNHKIVLGNVQTELDRHANEMAEIRNRTEAPQFFDYFPTYPEVTAWLDVQLRDYPALARSFTLTGSNIRGIQLGNNPSAKFFYIHCTIHAREWITTTTCCWIIEQLLTTDVKLLDKFTFLIVPVLNVNGYTYSHQSTRLWRKNRQTNSESSCIGTDLNRNYAVGWGGTGSSPDPCSDIYRGSNAFSGPETAAEQAFLDGYYGKVAAYVDIHAYGGYFMCPWGYTTALPPDYTRMNSLMTTAAAAIRAVNGRSYITGTSANAIYVAAGGSDDWAYGDGRVIPSFTVEAYGSNFTPPTSYIEPIGREIHASILALANTLPATG